MRAGVKAAGRTLAGNYTTQCLHIRRDERLDAGVRVKIAVRTPHTAEGNVQINSERVLDFHTHVFSAEVVKARERYFANEPWFETLYAAPQSRLATAADLASAMDRDGVSAAVALNFWVV